jgi:hypothetical protein
MRWSRITTLWQHTIGEWRTQKTAPSPAPDYSNLPDNAKLPPNSDDRIALGSPVGFGGLQTAHRNVDNLVDKTPLCRIIGDVSVGYGGCPKNRHVMLSF